MTTSVQGSGYTQLCDVVGGRSGLCVCVCMCVCVEGG